MYSMLTGIDAPHQRYARYVIARPKSPSLEKRLTQML